MTLAQILKVASLAPLAVMLPLLLVYPLVHRLGGPRRTWRRLRREAALTRRAFTDPLRAYVRHRRGLRRLTRQLADARTALRVRHALDAAAGALDAGAPGAFPYAVRVGPKTVAVQIAARRAPAPPAPWQVSDADRWRWWVGPDEVEGLPQAVAAERRARVPVAVGSAAGAGVHLDLAAGPGVLAVQGDPAAARRLVQALAAQLDGLGGRAGVAAVTVSDGVHPAHRGPELDVLLDRLERGGAARPASDLSEDPEQRQAAPEVVVCAAPSPGQMARLSVLAASGRALAVVLGPVAASCWALHVDAGGRVTAEELALDADASALGRAVAKALRAGRRTSAASPPSRAPSAARREAALVPAPATASPEAPAGLFAEPEPAATPGVTAGASSAAP